MLEASQVLAYVAALAIAAAIPGPGMTALVARSAGGGAAPGFAMLFGLVIGDLIYLSFAIFGLSVVAQSFNSVFIFVKFGACIYLCYLAWLFWTSEYKTMTVSKSSRRSDLISSVASGLAITLGNPKTIAFYLALLPLVINLESITVHSWGLILVPATIIVLFFVGSVFILGAVSVRHILSSDKAQRYLFRGAATAMLGAAGTMVAREI